MTDSNIDPGVELLADIPIAGPSEDLFGRRRFALRVVELACAAPETAPRVVALTGGCGSGKSSVLAMVSALLGERAGIATIAIDAQIQAGAQGLMAAISAELAKLFDQLGVVESRDKLRDALVSYGGIVSGLVRLAGVKVDIAGALERSAASLREEIARNLQQAGKRLVIALDHVDRLPAAELGGALAALRMYAAIPYVAVALALDRHELATRAAAGGDPRAYERLVHVEIALPPADRGVLSRVMTGGLRRVAARTGRDLAAAIALFDGDDGAGLALIETPRDAKRAINALSAALPLLPPEANPYVAALELVLRVLVPEIDGVRLDARHRIAAADRAALLAELAGALAHHPRAAAAGDALRVLIVGD